MSRSLISLRPAPRQDLRKAIAALHRDGIHLTITSTHRTFSEQKVLYTAYLEGRSKFPALPPGQSRHHLGLAVDLVPDHEACLERVVEVLRILNWKWAGPSDSVHFEWFNPITPRPDPFEVRRISPSQSPFGLNPTNILELVP
jgi:hypothetical protein